MIVNQNSLKDSLDPLMQGCIKKDRQAQNRLYGLFAPKMFVVCQRYAKNREEAEEILQEGFIRVFNHIHQVKSASSLEGWIRKIMVNCALQRYRSKVNLYPVISIDALPVEHYEEEDIIGRLGVKELIQMVQQLPPSYRMVFNLYVFEGMKHREIAEHLGISEGTSKSNLSDARAILQKAIHKNVAVYQKSLKAYDK